MRLLQPVELAPVRGPSVAKPPLVDCWLSRLQETSHVVRSHDNWVLTPWPVNGEGRQGVSGLNSILALFEILARGKKVQEIQFDLLYLNQACVSKEKTYFHTRHLRQWRLKTALYTSDIQISYMHLCCFTSVCPFVRCCVEGKLCRKLFCTLFCLVLIK